MKTSLKNKIGLEEGDFLLNENSNGYGKKAIAQVVAQIEARSLYMRHESRRAIEAYFIEGEAVFQPGSEPDDDQGIKVVAKTEPPLTLKELDICALQWGRLLSADPSLKAALIHSIGKKYGRPSENYPGLFSALGGDDPAVQGAYLDIYGKTYDESLPEVVESGEQKPLRSRETVLQEAVAGLEWLNLNDGEILYRESDPGDAIYVVVSGRLRVEMTNRDEQDQAPRVVGEIGRGELAGELEVFTGEPRNATLIAERDSEVVKLCQDEFTRLVDKYPSVLRQLNRVLARRLKAQYSEPRRANSTRLTFAVAPAGRGSRAEVRARFVRSLSHALSQSASVLTLNREMVDQELGEGYANAQHGHPDGNRLAAWINEQERQYDYIVYEADTETSEWSRRCLRQADCVLFVASDQANPRLNTLEKHWKTGQATARAELVLVHPASLRRPTGTQAWLAARNVQTHHHIRLEKPEDTQRLVRRLTSRALGLVLGGGGARGFAHIGVHQALIESGFQVDLIGGSSMGAIIGALYATGMDDKEVFAVARRFASRRKIFDPTLPVVSFFSSKKVTRILQEVFEDTQIEDLWQPFFCVSSSLTRALLVIHTQGSLWKALRASSAIPGIFSPMLHEGELLVDGAVLNNLPVDVMAEFSQGGPVVAVNVFPDVDLVKEYNFGPSVSGFQALIQKITPFVPDIQAPLIFENLTRVIALNDVHQARAKHHLADLIIRPPVEQYNILDFGAYRNIIDIGYQSGLAKLSQVLQSKSSASPSRLVQSLPPRPVDNLRQSLNDLDQILMTMNG